MNRHQRSPDVTPRLYFVFWLLDVLDSHFEAGLILKVVGLQDVQDFGIWLGLWWIQLTDIPKIGFFFRLLLNRRVFPSDFIGWTSFFFKLLSNWRVLLWILSDGFLPNGRISFKFSKPHFFY
ncbi:unnamed protein product [Rhizophagus irregularis]|nr:unnamed protein product [Rhizophagus irregularis]